MKRLLFAILIFAPMLSMAQNNTWEVPQQETSQQTKASKTVNKVSKVQKTDDPKYLAEAITLNSDGKVVFTLDYDCPGLTVAEIYNRMYRLMDQLTKADGQLAGSKIAIVNKAEHKIVTTFKENLVFSKSLLSLDQTEFHYTMVLTCTEGHLHAEMARLYYLYEIDRKTGMKAPAEDVITDKISLNKKKTRLANYYGKFRKKTIDRKDNLFQQIVSALK